jgi:hypothetical protein
MLQYSLTISLPTSASPHLTEWAGKHQERFKMVYVIGTRWKVPIIGAKTANPIYPAPPDGFETLTYDPFPTNKAVKE